MLLRHIHFYTPGELSIVSLILSSSIPTFFLPPSLSPFFLSFLNMSVAI